ncbi:MAG: UDP-N-acetylglucosamine 1-carboxyvinyltransferase, partial [Planctomycetota bacterium]
MDKLVLTGGRPLNGAVRVAGAKNAVLPTMAASLLTDEPLELRGAPRLSDVSTMQSVLNALGVDASSTDEDDGTRTLRLIGGGEIHPEAGWEHVRKMRGSVCVLGPLVSRVGRAEVSLP